MKSKNSLIEYVLEVQVESSLAKFDCARVLRLFYALQSIRNLNFFESEDSRNLSPFKVTFKSSNRSATEWTLLNLTWVRFNDD